MPVHNNFKLLEIEKEFTDDSEYNKNMQISINNLVNLEPNHNTDTNQGDSSPGKSSLVSGLALELNASSTTQCEVEVEKHLRCSASHANCGVSQGQHLEVRSKIGHHCDAQDSLSVMCQRKTATGVFLKQKIDGGLKPSTARSINSFGLSAVEYAKMPINKLRAIAEDLAQTVEEASSELVSLLLENDALQQESDARNIAIEQLLKLTWKQTENELRPVQMPVVLPSDTCDSDVD